MKKCCACKIAKMLERFGKNKSTKDGLQRECSDCRRESCRKYRIKNPEKRRETIRNHYVKNKDKKAEYARNNRNKANLCNRRYKAKPETKIKTKIYNEITKDTAKDRLFRRCYGISLKQIFQIEKEQDFKCLICNYKKELVIDHCHATGNFRGLLCSQCNSLIGLIKENKGSLQRAIMYLQNTEQLIEVTKINNCVSSLFPINNKAGWKEKILEKKYNINLMKYEDMRTKQGYACLICQKLEKNGRNLTVDHCHTTGKVRGLLCTNCNLALGFAHDNPDILQSAIEYLANRDTASEHSYP